MTDPRKGRQETIGTLISREGILMMLIMDQLGGYFFTLCGFKMTSFQGGEKIHWEMCVCKVALSHCVGKETVYLTQQKYHKGGGNQVTLEQSQR